MRIALLVGALALVVPMLPGTASAATSPVKITKVRYDAPGKDTTANKSVNGEYVVIKNTGAKTITLTKWVLHDESRHFYYFAPFKLKAHKSVTVRTGKGKNTATTLYMGRGWHIWNNDHDSATLRNAKHQKVSVVSWGKKKPPVKPTPENDPRFPTCAAANAAGYGPYYRGVDPEYAWYIDRDKDGVVCER
jgi:hypothetical protein